MSERSEDAALIGPRRLRGWREHWEQEADAWPPDDDDEHRGHHRELWDEQAARAEQDDDDKERLRGGNTEARGQLRP